VKETVKNDERVAKEMERAGRESTEQLPTYRAYEDGAKWVELKLPEKLTPEQAKGVRSREELEDVPGSTQKQFIGGDPAARYFAVDKDGKPIENAYTREPATGATPEEAWLAGHLAREGNCMGHCVGGYNSRVASGETRIYSLRDKKGNSHVTVEASAPRAPEPMRPLEWHFDKIAGEQDWRATDMAREALGRTPPEARARFIQAIENSQPYKNYLAALKNRVKDAPWTIDQIKGKQNRAPNSEYIPYVQDFVKSGKWADVGDLGNTGLRQNLQGDKLVTQREFMLEQAAEYQKQLEKWQDNLKYYEDELKKKITPEYRRELEAERKQAELEVGDAEQRLGAHKRDIEGVEEQPLPPLAQRGAIDPSLMRGMALAGAGGALFGMLDKDQPLYSAGVGAALGAMASRGFRASTRGRVTSQMDKAFGLLSTRTLNMDKQLHRALIDFEYRQADRSAFMREQVDPFLVRLDKQPKALREDLNRAILSNDGPAIDALIRKAGDAELAAGWRGVRKMLDSAGQELVRTGRLGKLLTDYFPRIVADREGLMNHLERPVRTQLENMLLEAENRVKQQRGTGLTQLEESRIINDFLLQPNRRGSQPQWAKRRSIPEITKELEPFYLTPTDSLHSYIRTVSHELEKARFFGKDAAWVDANGQKHINIDRSVGNVAQRLLDAGKIDHGQMVELSEMLKARFGPGEQMSRKGPQAFRNITNSALLGNPLSAITQLGDVMPSMYVHGMMPTLQAIGQILTRQGNMKPRDIGLVNHISEELVTTTGAAKLLQRVLKYSGFSAADAFGKTVNLQAARIKAERMAQTAEGRAKFMEQYGEAWGPAETLNLLADLGAKKLTPRTRSFYFDQLSRSQPISKMEVSQRYLENADIGLGVLPLDARTLYQLKSFMLKQADLMRREGYNEIKAGNTGKGFANLAALGTLLGLSGALPDMIKDFLLGKPFDAKWEDIPLNMLKTFGWSTYMLDKATGATGQKAEPISAVVGGFLVPPYKVFEDILRRDPNAVKYLPVVGKILAQEEWSDAGQRMGKEKRMKEELRKVDREERPLLGKPDADERRRIQERKRGIRENNRDVMEDIRRRREAERRMQR